MPHYGDSSAHRMLHIDGAGRGSISSIGYTHNTLGSGCAGGSYLTPYANANVDSVSFVASRVPLHALSLREEKGQDNEHASPPQGYGDEDNSAAMAHGGRAPTSDRLWEQEELGEKIFQCTSCTLHARAHLPSSLHRNTSRLSNARTSTREKARVSVCTKASVDSCAAGLSSSQITGLRMQAPSYFMSGNQIH